MTTVFTKDQMAAFAEVATKRAEKDVEDNPPKYRGCGCDRCTLRRRDAIDTATRKHLEALTGGEVVRVLGVWQQLLPPVSGMTSTGYILDQAAAVPAKTVTKVGLYNRLAELSSHVTKVMDDFCTFEQESDEDQFSSEGLDTADTRFREAFAALRRAINPSDNY